MFYCNDCKNEFSEPIIIETTYEEYYGVSDKFMDNHKMSLDTIKVVLIGESGTGKTSIIQQYAYKIFDPDCATSISSQYISKTIKESI